jgi:hypothetical protein
MTGRYPRGEPVILASQSRVALTAASGGQAGLIFSRYAGALLRLENAMRALRSLTLVLGCVLALSSSLALAAKAPAQLAGQTQARDKALLAFQRDLVSVLSPSADPQSLLAAALLARTLPDQSQVNSFHKLIGRASAAEGAGAAQWWVQLTDCDAQADACPNPAALNKLGSLAADNAAYWMLKLGVDERNANRQAAREDLHQAAAAKLYDDYTGISLKALASNVSVLPPPPATLDPAATAGAAGMQIVMVLGIASSQPQPALQAVAKLCESGKDDASIKTDCLTLGKLLEWGSSPLGRSLGLHLREVLADDPAQQRDAKRARLNLVWQVQNFSLLTARAQNDKALAQHLIALARSGGTEMSMLLAALHDYGIAADAPTDWQPSQPG